MCSRVSLITISCWDPTFNSEYIKPSGKSFEQLDHSSFSFTRISFDFCCVGALAIMLMWQSVGKNLALKDLCTYKAVFLLFRAHGRGE